MGNQENLTPMSQGPIATPYDYHFLLQYVSKLGKDMFGRDFIIDDVDKPVITKLLAYFLKDKTVAEAEGLDLKKGILLMGPTGCGKTAIMKIMSNFCAAKDRLEFRSSNEVVLDFDTRAYEAIIQFTKKSFYSTGHPRVYCFDDLGLEPDGHHYGKSVNVMREVLLSRYNYFISRRMITHVTTKLYSEELGERYGEHIRSRMREMFNRVLYVDSSPDKRH
ncbi:hypothetical protein SAMN05661012_04167 [Chitinophaga sancti]|uniref:AAA+ ATPase domain-containing protein n=2 Tax=Chitinophaga sancti TaxID=1004 RepID=A0A1K1RRG6_9BACT|nr:hypothetical protein SAMN05661012_04167 [Chitinophaga sancti]